MIKKKITVLCFEFYGFFFFPINTVTPVTV